MPDDNMEVAEQVESNPDFDKGFAAQVKEDKPKEIDDPIPAGDGPAPDKPKEGAAAAAADKAGQEEGGAAGAGKDEKTGQKQGADQEPSAMDKLEALAKETAGSEKGVEKEPGAEGQGAGEKPAKVADQKPKADAEQGTDLFQDVPGLGDVKIKVDGVDVPMKEFAAQYPEVAQASLAIGKAVGKTMAGELIKDMVKAGQILTGDAVKGLQAQVANMEFWQGVTEKHPDARTIAASKEFWDWMNKQSPGIQVLRTSLNVENGVAVMDAYKESAAKAAKSGADKEATAAKNAKDNLHKETLREKKTAEEGGKGKDDDFDSGFNAAAR
ncbi:MAG: hypothetical protein WC551_12810 [Patescibacteria group bacterium]|jgi:hypothetical protein